MQSSHILPEGNTLESFFDAYTSTLSKALKSVSRVNMERALAVLKAARDSRAHIYVAGNGGSAAISDHLCCDWSKGTETKNHPSIKVHSLVSNAAFLTALSNDLGYERSLEYQIEQLGEKNDVLVLISSSGKSENILRAAEAAQKKGMTVIGLTGFSGGGLREFSEKNPHVSLHVDAPNYGIIEDSHQALMHILAQYLFVTTRTPAAHA